MANMVGKIRNIHSAIANVVCVISWAAVSNIMGCSKNVLPSNMDYSSTSPSPVLTPSPIFTSSIKSKKCCS